MPTNHTEHYNLSQWERSDKVVMDDFNADNAKIDAAVKAVDRRVDGLAAGKVDAAEVPRLEQAIAAKAAIVTGTYTGNDEETRIINLGFTPKALFVITDGGFTAAPGSAYYYGGLAFPDYPVYHDRPIVAIVENGFQVAYNSSKHILSNAKNKTYLYIALM